MVVVFTLNGKKLSTEVSAQEPLLNVLRRNHVASVRSGCDTGNCGICTVWVDGTPVLSCSYPAPRVEGKQVTTVEGSPSGLQELMDELAREGADQCGFCSPGFMMSVLAMLRDYDDPTDEQIRAYLSGNLCRCTGYESQARALRRILDRRHGRTRE